MQSINNETYTISFPKQIPCDIIAMEEEERKDRMERKVDPMFMCKLAQVQKELLIKRLPYKVMYEAKSTLTHSAKGMDNLSTNFSVEVNNKVADYKQELTDSAHNLAGRMHTKVHEVINMAKEKIHRGDISSIASGEKERSRKMSETVDPMVESRRHAVETELLQTIKMVN